MKFLIVVDMQNDFIDGSLGTKEAQAILPKVIEKVKNSDIGKGIAVLFTQDTHDGDYLESLEGKNLPVEHCIIYTSGWEIQDGLKDIFEGHLLGLNKPTFGCLDLIEFIQINFYNEEIESFELVGVCTDICVISNALLLKTFFPEIPIVVDASCCAGVTPESHKNALSAMKMCQIEIINEEK